MGNKIVISLLIVFMSITTFCNCCVYAERYDTGDKVIYTDKYGRATQIIDKSTFSQAGETSLKLENICAIVFVLCLVIGFILYNCIKDREEENKTLEKAFEVVVVIGIISLIIYALIYLAAGGWSAH